MNAFLRAALRQPSTWRGLVWIVAGLLGLTLSDSDTNVLASAAMIVAGALGAMPLDRGREDGVRDRLPPIDLVGRADGEWVQRHQSVDLSPGVDPQAPDRRAPADSPDRGGWNG